MIRLANTTRMLAVGAALAGGLLFTVPAHAQDRQNDGPRREQGARMDPAQRLDRQVARLTERLRLSNEQAGQVRAILQREQTEMRALRERDGGARPQPGQRPDGVGAQQFRAIRERGEQSIERVLNAGQRAEYAKLREEQRQRGDDRRGGRRDGKAPRGGGDHTRR